MDPNECLKRILAEAATVLTTTHQQNDRVIGMAEAVKNLDEWLAKGGFLPKAWARAPEQVFEVRVLTVDGEGLTVGRYRNYTEAFNHVATLKSERCVEAFSRLDIVNAVVVPVEVLP